MPDGAQIPGGPVFIGFPQPADVPCDPTGDGWRGPPGPAGPQGVPGIDGDVISGGPFLPLVGGIVTGQTTFPNVALNGAGNILTGPNGLNVTANFQGSGIPGFANSGRMIMTNNAPAAGDFCDFQVQRNTSFTGGSGALTAVMRVLGSYGAGDASGNWNFVSQAQSSGSGGIALGGFLTAQRVAGSNPVFGAVINGNDTTGLVSASGSEVVGVEIDCECQLQDNGTNASMLGGTGVRIAANIVAVRHNAAVTSPPTEVSAGVWFTSATNPPTSGTSDPYTSFLSAIAFGVGLQAYQALDTRAAVVPTGVVQPFAAVRMAHDQIIDFNGGTTLKSVAGAYLQYRSATQRLYYVVAGVDQWSIDASGNVRARGTVTGSTTP